MRKDVNINVGEIIMMFIGAVALVVFLGALMAFPVMWLWNSVMPNLFVASVTKEIGFSDAWRLLVLCGLLFKSTLSKP